MSFLNNVVTLYRYLMSIDKRSELLLAGDVRVRRHRARFSLYIVACLTVALSFYLAKTTFQSSALHKCIMEFKSKPSITYFPELAFHMFVIKFTDYPIWFYFTIVPCFTGLLIFGANYWETWEQKLIPTLNVICATLNVMILGLVTCQFTDQKHMDFLLVLTCIFMAVLALVFSFTIFGVGNDGSLVDAFLGTAVDIVFVKETDKHGPNMSPRGIVIIVSLALLVLLFQLVNDRLKSWSETKEVEFRRLKEERVAEADAAQHIDADNRADARREKEEEDRLLHRTLAQVQMSDAVTRAGEKTEEEIESHVVNIDHLDESEITELKHDWDSKRKGPGKTLKRKVGDSSHQYELTQKEEEWEEERTREGYGMDVYAKSHLD